jgi:general secretion pathway protein M
MKVEISPFRQRLIALGLLGLVGLVVVFWLVLPLWQTASLHAERVAVLRRQVLTMQGLVEARPRFEAGIAALGANEQVRNLTLAAGGSAVAGAELQGQLTQILSAASAVVTSTQLLPEAREGALTRVSLQVNAEGDTRALVRALHEIGNARPLLRVERLVIRDPDGVFAMKPEAVLANRLIVEMTVSAPMGAP